MILEKIAQSNGNLMMGTGLSFSWFFFGIEWIDDHSGFFIAMGAMISTIVTIIGAVRASKSRQESERNAE